MIGERDHHDYSTVREEKRILKGSDSFSNARASEAKETGRGTLSGGDNWEG